MRVYKEKQFLIFDFEDGQTVKYDFATRQSIGKSGKPVKDLRTQLRGIKINDIIESCVDEKYGKYLKFLSKRTNGRGYEIYNIGSILQNHSYYSNFEQFFSAGFDSSSFIDPSRFHYKLSEVPKGLLKLCKTYNFPLDSNIVERYSNSPDLFNLVYSLDYVSLNKYSNGIGSIYWILNTKDTKVSYKNSSMYIVDILTHNFGYTVKSLFTYLDYLATYEALSLYNIRELYDYATMMNVISPKFEKYPRHFLSTHAIASRNYNRLKQKFSENLFQNRIDSTLEDTYKEYIFKYPTCTQDIKDEAVQQNNCVASYIQRVIDGDCHIMFLRKKDTPDKSLITLEIVNNQIVQAKRKFNEPVSNEEQKVIEYWNQKHKNIGF